MISISILSKKMNITQRRVRQLLKEIEKFSSDNKLRPKPGLIDEIEFFLSYIKLIEENNEKRKLKGSDLLKAQTRLRLAQAQRAELEIEKNQKRLVPKQISIDFISIVFGNIRNKLLGARHRIAFQIFGSKTLKEADIKTNKIIDEILNELSDPKSLYKKG